MDPLLAIGAVASAVKAATTAIGAFENVDKLRQTYSNASTTFASLRAESETVGASLAQLDRLVNTAHSNTLATAVRSNQELSAVLGRTLKGCDAVYTRLNEELGTITHASSHGNGGKLDWTRDHKIVIEETVLQDYLAQIRGHQTALTLFLRMHSTDDIASLVFMLTLLLNTLREQMPTMQRAYSFRASSEGETVAQPSLQTADISSLFDELPRDSLCGNRSSLGDGAPANLLPPQRAGKSKQRDSLEPLNTENFMFFGPGPSQTVRKSTDTDEQREFGYKGNSVHGSPSCTPFRSSPHANRGHGSKATESEQIHHDSVDTSKIVVCDEEEAVARRFSVRTVGSVQSASSLVPDIPSVIAEESGPKSVPPDPAANGLIVVEEEDSGTFKIPVESLSGESSATAALRSPISPLSANDIRRESDQTLSSRASIATSVSSLPEVVGGVSIFPTPGPASHPLPPQAKEIRETLDMRKQQVLRSNDLVAQLEWAEEALIFVCTDRDHRKSKARSDSPWRDELDRDAGDRDQDQTLEKDACNIVERLAQSASAKALFLKARWFGLLSGEQNNLYLKALSRGYLRAVYYLGRWYEQLKNKKDSERYYRQGAEGGDAACLYRLAEAALKGELNEKRDPKRGIQLLHRAAGGADADFPEPLYRLATLHASVPARKELKLKSTHLPLDPSIGLAHYIRAAALGHAGAQLTLGIAYARPNLTLPMSPPLSLHYLRLAARQGSAAADLEISNWFWWGAGSSLPPQARPAFEFARRAVRRSGDGDGDGAGDREVYASAFCQLGFYYETGVGTAVNKSKAKDCYLRGAALGDATAMKRLDAMKVRI